MLRRSDLVVNPGPDDADCDDVAVGRGIGAGVGPFSFKDIDLSANGILDTRRNGDKAARLL
jgi:hypothetical protein